MNNFTCAADIGMDPEQYVENRRPASAVSPYVNDAWMLFIALHLITPRSPETP
jgi:hypothetical protein